MPYYRMPDQEKLFVREIGQGEPVLILSGLGMSSWQWLPFIWPSLAKRRFIIPDYRGFGGSKQCRIPEGMSAIESHWRDIDCLIQQLSTEQNNEIDVVGYSMGATTTMHGLHYGDFAKRIKRYLHIDQTAKIKNDTAWSYGLFGQRQQDFLSIITEICDLLGSQQQRYQKVAELPADIQKQLMTLWSKFMQLQKPSLHAEPRGFIQGKLGKLPLHRIQAQLLPMQSIDYILWYLQTYLDHDEDYRTALAALNKPAHFIVGKQSTLYDYRGQLQVAEQLADATIHVLQRSGHVPLMNQPVQFSRLLNQFLQA